MEDERKDTLREQPEQAEQPVDKKKADSGMILGLCLGLAVGAGIGALTKNLGLWMPIGMCLGMVVGMAFDGEKKKKNERDDGDDQPQA